MQTKSVIQVDLELFLEKINFTWVILGKELYNATEGWSLKMDKFTKESY